MRGLGAHMLARIELWASTAGVSFLMCESGVQNEDAHRFFTHRGFRDLSKVFIKPLDE